MRSAKIIIKAIIIPLMTDSNVIFRNAFIPLDIFAPWEVDYETEASLIGV